MTLAEIEIDLKEAQKITNHSHFKYERFGSDAE
jgi:hypothetical protein